MKIKPIQSDRLSDKIVEQMIGMMRDGTLGAGERLPNEEQLAEKFGVSRGILREALTILQAQGFLRRRPKDGTYVQENIEAKLMSQSLTDAMKKATWADLLEFREVLEGRIVEKAVERASDEELAELMETITGPPEPSPYRSLDHYFHYRLAQLSQNPFFMNFIDTYYDIIREIGRTSNRNDRRSRQIADEHLAIMRAILARDSKAARQAVIHHLKMVDESLKTADQTETEGPL